MQSFSTAGIAIALSVLFLLVTPLGAQLTPERLYCGVGQRVVVTVDAPEDYNGELTIRLHDPRTFKVLGTAPAARGRTDLTSLFPSIWADKSHAVVLAQLYLGPEATGAPLVLQPMVTPNRAMLVDAATMRVSDEKDARVVFEDDRQSTRFANGQVESPERDVTYCGLRVYVEQEVVLETSVGEIAFRLRPDAAPNTAFNFMHLVEGGFYTNIIFHRIVAALADGRPFVVQMGDPSGTGAGGPGYAIDLEKSALAHDFGVLSMARGGDPDTNGSQVFVCLSREGTAFLDGRYTAFAQAISGADVIREIAASAVDANDRPLDPPLVLSARLRDAAPVGRRASPISTSGRAEGVGSEGAAPARTDR